MKAIISPAKKMRVLPGFADLTEPFFIKRAEEMAEYLKTLEPHEIESHSDYTDITINLTA